MKRSLILCITVLSLSVLGCSGDDEQMVEEQSIVFPEIIGVWEWVGTTGGIAAVSETPESTGNTRDIIITEDTFTFYINETIIAERGYTFTFEESNLTGEEEFIVTFGDDGFRDIVRREDEIINFIDDCTDCFTSIYKVKD